jgi:hypothetical protein
MIAPVGRRGDPTRWVVLPCRPGPAPATDPSSRDARRMPIPVPAAASRCTGAAAWSEGAGAVAGLSAVALSEVLAALSYAIDPTDGLPAGDTVRSCPIGMCLAEELELDAAARWALYCAAAQGRRLL